MPPGRLVTDRKRALTCWIVVLLLVSACNFGSAAPGATMVPNTSAKPVIVFATLLPSPTNPPPTATPTPIPSETPTPTLTFTPSQTLTPTPFCAEATGQVLDETIPSTVSQTATGQASVDYRVYLPPCYASSKASYPYVFLFHGVDGDQTEWTDTLGVNHVLDQDIAKGRLPPMILVMPNGGLMAYNNYFVDGQSYESFIVDELLLEVERRFCTWGDASGRAIGGISRGGFWAYEIGFRHPALFSAIGGHSAFFDPQNAPPEYNPLDLAQTVTFLPGTQPRLWLDTGPDDAVHPTLDNFAQTLTARHIDPGYTVYSTGGHTDDYWMSHMADYLAFYGLHWPRHTSDLPVCRHTAL